MTRGVCSLAGGCHCGAGRRCATRALERISLLTSDGRTAVALTYLAIAPAERSNVNPMPQTKPMAGARDNDAQKKLEAIARILGIEPTDAETICAAFNALIVPTGEGVPPDESPNGAKVAASYATPHGIVSLSQHELRVCEQLGCLASEYAATKAAGLASRGRAR